MCINELQSLTRFCLTVICPGLYKALNVVHASNKTNRTPGIMPRAILINQNQRYTQLCNHAL